MTTKHIVCYSGGKSSALVAVMCVKRFGKENVVLLNHRVDAEPKDVERFENEVAGYLDIQITYANAEGLDELTPLGVFNKGKRFSAGLDLFCTAELKTKPFMKWLKQNYNQGDIIYYGFTSSETKRIQRRSGILGSQGYKTDYPLVTWASPLDDGWFDMVGIQPPNQYSAFKHANCMCCWKAGIQSWYVYYINCPDLFEQHLQAELEIGHSISRRYYLHELKKRFDIWKAAGIPASEHEKGFLSKAHAAEKQFGLVLNNIEEDTQAMPCDCVF